MIEVRNHRKSFNFRTVCGEFRRRGDFGRWLRTVCVELGRSTYSIIICAHIYYAFCGFNVALCLSSSAKLDLKGVWYLVSDTILWNSMTSTSCVFTELANTMKYGGGFLYTLVFTEWCHCVSQNKVWGRRCYTTLFSPSDVTAFHRILYRSPGIYKLFAK